MSNYAAIAKDQETNKDGGYQNSIWFAPISTFLSVAKPAANPAAVGDTLKITDAHTFTAPAGFYPWRAKKHSVTIDGTPVGDPGSMNITWKLTAIILGDSASTQEQMQNMLNDDILYLVKDQNCEDGTYVQLGDECLTPEVQVTFTGNTTAQGYKEYKIEASVKGKKFFYSGAVTDQGAGGGA